MFKHLLVPLDGSHLAEAALPAAAYLARTLDASVTLIHIIERNAPQAVHGERHLADSDEACAYLKETAARAFPAGARVDSHVHTTEESDVARSLVAHAGELRPDLIVMCAHGRSGLRGLLFGTIAQQVIASGETPVLLIHPEAGEAEPGFDLRRLLVPLDGDPDHEQGLAVAAGLARACRAAVHLLMVVRTVDTLGREHAETAKLLPGAMSALLDFTQENAEEYLRRQGAQVQALGLSATAEVNRGDPAVMIARTAQRLGADLIVLGTHGKAGLDAFWAESIAAKVAARTHAALLLVPVRSSSADESWPPPVP